MDMSELLREIVNDWLEDHEGEELEEGNSNRAVAAD